MKKTLFLLFALLSIATLQAQTADELVKKGMERAGKKDYKGAIGFFDKAIAINPNISDVYLTRVYCIANSGDFDKAKEEAAKIPALFPDSMDAQMSVASFFSDVKDFDEAVEIYDNIFKKFTGLPDTTMLHLYLIRGSLKHSMNDTQAAKEDYDKAAAIDSNDANVMISLAGVYDDLGKPEESVRLMTKVIKQDPENILLYNNLGFVYNNMGKYKEAVDIFNKSIALNEKKKDYINKEILGFTYSNRGHAKYKLGDNKGALKDFEKSIELAPSNSYVFKNRALVYIAMNKNKEACLDLYRAISLGFSDMYGNEVEKLINAYCR